MSGSEINVFASPACHRSFARRYNVTYDVLRNVTYDVTFNQTYNVTFNTTVNVTEFVNATVNVTTTYNISSHQPVDVVLALDASRSVTRSRKPTRWRLHETTSFNAGPSRTRTSPRRTAPAANC